MTIDLLVFWRSKLLLLMCLVLGIAGGAGYLAITPTVYEGQARVLVEPRDVQPTAELLGRVDPEFLPTQAETIRSPVTIARALKSTPVTPPPDADPETFVPSRYVLRSLTVTPILNANVLTVAYRGSDPDEVLAIMGGVIEAYKSDVAELDQGDSKTSIHVLAARERELRQDVEDAQQRVDQLRRESPLLGMGRASGIESLTRLNHLAAQLADMRTRRADLEARLATVDDQLEVAAVARDREAQFVSANADRETVVTMTEEVLRFADPIDAQPVLEVEENLRMAQLRAAQLDETLGPKHPDLLAAQREVDEYETLMRKRLQEVFDSWEQRLKVIRATELDLERTYAKEQAEAKKGEEYLVREEHLKANLVNIERLHTATLEQLLTMQSAEDAIVEGRTSISVRVLEEPTLVDEMEWPNPKLVLPAAAMLGLLGGFCLVCVREFQSLTARAESPSETSA